MANGVIPLAKASGVRSRVPSGWTRWNGPLARLHFRQVRSRDHDQRYTEHFDGPAPGANGWPGTRFLVKVDDVGRRQLAEPPSSTPTAVRAPGSLLGVFDPAGGRESPDELAEQRTFAHRAKRWAKDRAEDLLTGEVEKWAVTAIGGAAGAGLLAAGAPLVVGGLVAASPSAVRWVLRRKNDQPGADERRAWIGVPKPASAELLLPEGTLRPSTTRPLADIEAELSALTAKAASRLQDVADAARSELGDTTALHTYDLARAQLRTLHRGARFWCEHGMYPSERYQLLLFDGGDRQLVDELWRRVTT